MIKTDYRALQWLQLFKDKNVQLTQWSLGHQPYTFTVMHHKRRENANADAMSQIPQEELSFALKKEEGNVTKQDVHPEIQSEGTRIQQTRASGSLNRIKNEANQLNYRKQLQWKSEAFQLH